MTWLNDFWRRATPHWRDIARKWVGTQRTQTRQATSSLSVKKGNFIQHFKWWSNTNAHTHMKSWHSQTRQKKINQMIVTRRWDNIKNVKKFTWHHQEKLAEIFHKRANRPWAGSTRHPGEWTTGLCCAWTRRRVIHCGKSEQGDAVKVSCLSAWDQEVCAMSIATTIRPLGTVV